MFKIDLIKSVVPFLNICSSSPKLWLTSSTSKSIPLQCLQTAKFLISSSRRIGETIMWQLLAKHSDNCDHYFYYNSHHHYHYHHFHYHCKMHLYCLKIVLTILLYCNLIPCFFSKILSSFYRLIFLSTVIPNFSLFTPSKRTQIRLRPSDIF